MKPLNDSFFWDMIDRLRDNIEELKLLSCGDDCQDTINYCNKLKAEIKGYIKMREGYLRKIKELKAENKRICKRNRDLQVHVDKYGALRHDELQADNVRLMKQVSSNRGSNSNTIQREIAEYVDHNPKGMGARMFLIPRNEFAHGEYNHTIYWEDGMSS